MTFKCILITSVLLMWGTPSAQAEPIPDAIRTELAALAKDITQIIQKKGGGSIAVGGFTGPVDLAGHAGPGVQLVLADELQKAGLTVVSENFTYEVAGRYQKVYVNAQTREVIPGEPHGEQSLLTVKLVAHLIDSRTGDILAERPTGRLIFGSEAVPGLLGMQLSIPPIQDPTLLSEKLEQALLEPQVNISGTKISGKQGYYSIEVLVKQGDQYLPKSVETDKGSPFVLLETNDIYGIRLNNHSEHQAAVDLKIDGINCFAFSSSTSRYWIIPPNSHLDVLGWHKNDSTTVEFKVVGEFPDTAAAKLNLKPSTKIGLITASFSACWENDSERPADEPRIDGRGTGFGNEISFNTRKVQRTIGQIRDSIAVRYER